MHSSAAPKPEKLNLESLKTVLRKAVTDGQFEKVKKWLNYEPQLIWTPLTSPYNEDLNFIAFAAKLDKWELVQQCLKSEIFVGLPATEDYLLLKRKYLGYALCYAIISKRQEEAELLLKHDADASKFLPDDPFKANALHIAIYQCSPEMVRLILQLSTSNAAAIGMDRDNRAPIATAIYAAGITKESRYLLLEAFTVKQASPGDPEKYGLALLYAASQGEADLCLKLLDANAHLSPEFIFRDNSNESAGNTALHEACRKNLPAVVAAILKKNPSDEYVQIKNVVAGKTAYMLAIEDEYTECSRHFGKRGWDTLKPEEKITKLELVVRKNNVEDVIACLLSEPQILQSPIYGEFNVIAYAAMRGHWEIVLRCLQESTLAKESLKQPKYLSYALCYAASLKRLEEARLLLECGADASVVLLPDVNKNNALHRAVQSQSPEMVRLILQLSKSNAAAIGKNKDNRTPMVEATYILPRDKEAGRLVIEAFTVKQASPGDPEEYGWGLCSAASFNEPDLCLKLLEANAHLSGRFTFPLNMGVAGGNSALHEACRNNLPVVVAAIINRLNLAPAPNYINLKNAADKTAIEIASNMGHEKCEDAFIAPHRYLPAKTAKRYLPHGAILMAAHLAQKTACLKFPTEVSRIILSHHFFNADSVMPFDEGSKHNPTLPSKLNRFYLNRVKIFIDNCPKKNLFALWRNKPNSVFEDFIDRLKKHQSSDAPEKVKVKDIQNLTQEYLANAPVADIEIIKLLSRCNLVTDIYTSLAERVFGRGSVALICAPLFCDLDVTSKARKLRINIQLYLDDAEKSLVDNIAIEKIENCIRDTPTSEDVMKLFIENNLLSSLLSAPTISLYVSQIKQVLGDDVVDELGKLFLDKKCDIEMKVKQIRLYIESHLDAFAVEKCTPDSRKIQSCLLTARTKDEFMKLLLKEILPTSLSLDSKASSTALQAGSSR